jgi:hypothetical protein
MNLLIPPLAISETHRILTLSDAFERLRMPLDHGLVQPVQVGTGLGVSLLLLG